MKKIICVSLTALSLLIGTAALSAESTAPTAKSAPTPTIKKAPETAISLYESPETSAKVIKTLPINTNLVAIFRKGDWIKVGDQQDGSIGWINLKQYHEAKQNFYRAHFQTHMESVYISTSKDKDGNTFIEAYRNGKKLTATEAKKLFSAMQSQERHQMQIIDSFNQTLNKELQMDFLQTKPMGDSHIDAPLFFLPGIIVINHSSPTKTDDTAKKPVVKK